MNHTSINWKQIIRAVPPQIVGGIFLVAAISKGSDPIRFGRQIEILILSSGIPLSFDTTILGLALACAVLLLEIVFGAMLAFRIKPRIAALGTAVMLAGFIVIIIWEIIKQSGADCGCFGALLKRSGPQALVEDIIMLLFLLPAFWEQTTTFTRRRMLIMLGLIDAAAISIVLFTIFPPQWAALRTGMAWHPSAIASLETKEKYSVWVFDPDCVECQDAFPRVNAISATLPTIGLAAVTKGKLDEFILDFEPMFPVTSVTKEEFERFGLFKGSLLYIHNGKIEYIWRPKQIPSTEQITKMEAL